MLIMFVAFLVAAFAILCIRVPSVWFALMATDEPSDARELSLVVASRALHLLLPPLSLSTLHEALTPAPRTPPTGNPFRESGPPACMAKLIMMRHKVRNAPLPLCSLHPRFLTPVFFFWPRSWTRPTHVDAARAQPPYALRHASSHCQHRGSGSLRGYACPNISGYSTTSRSLYSSRRHDLRQRRHHLRCPRHPPHLFRFIGFSLCFIS